MSLPPLANELIALARELGGTRTICWALVLSAPLLVPYVRRHHPAALPGLHAAQHRLNNVVTGPFTVLVLVFRIYLATEGHRWDEPFVGVGIGAIAIIAVVGGLLGNMVGGGNGRKLATVAGAVGGGYAGNEIEKNQKSHTVWVVQVRERDGRLRRFERSADPGLRVGDEVRLTENGFTRA